MDAFVVIEKKDIDKTKENIKNTQKKDNNKSELEEKNKNLEKIFQNIDKTIKNDPAMKKKLIVKFAVMKSKMKKDSKTYETIIEIERYIKNIKI